MKCEGSARGAVVGLVVAALAGAGCGGQGAAPDGGGGGADAGPTLNQCEAAQFVDRSGAADNRTVGFGGEMGSGVFDYTPRCMTIAAGQSVTFVGSFNTHPLSPGVDPAQMAAGSPNNPIGRTAMGNSATVTFPAPGTYPYFCDFHYAAGMAGVIRVR